MTRKVALEKILEARNIKDVTDEDLKSDEKQN